ncbi:cyclin-H-like [Tigriopus californicus]|nr:cyclin-H-like [Tigriopus californicus]
MFVQSTQCRFWMFASETEIQAAQQNAHNQFIQDQLEVHGQHAQVTAQDAATLLRYHEKKLIEFTQKFQPPMPKNTQGTALIYFKRFFLRNCILQYEPKDVLVTAAFLACKVEEFNVSIDQFVANIQGNKERAIHTILSNELLLIRELRFHLTIHNPYRSVEGFLIDLKVNFPELADPQTLREPIERFLSEAALTNACFIYSPSQIALAAVIQSAMKSGSHVDSYVTNRLLGPEYHFDISQIVDVINGIRYMAKRASDLPDASTVRGILEKMAHDKEQIEQLKSSRQRYL